MDVHVPEGHFIHEFQSHHDHARDPEKDYVKSGNKDRSRIELLQLGRAVGPAQGRKRPERGRKPGIKHIFILPQGRSFAFGAFGWTPARYDNLAAGIAIPRGDSVPPPYLSRDAPVIYIFHPRIEGVFPTL